MTGSGSNLSGQTRSNLSGQIRSYTGCGKALINVKVVNWSVDLPLDKLKANLSKYGMVVKKEPGSHPKNPLINRKETNDTVLENGDGGGGENP